MKGLVLSLYPGAGLFDMAFEAEGWCVVRGPELLLGGDNRRFRVIRGRFDGIIGGPPCQPHSDATIGHAPKHECLIGDFARCLEEGAPAWWVMEQVKKAPYPPQLPLSPPLVTGLSAMRGTSGPGSAARGRSFPICDYGPCPYVCPRTRPRCQQCSPPSTSTAPDHATSAELAGRWVGA